jgi:secondary thiamine-phosphate synthase enzyme
VQAGRLDASVTLKFCWSRPAEPAEGKFEANLLGCAVRNPSRFRLRHWGDDNGSSHLRAALLKPSLTIPFKDGKLLNGTWQQIVLIDFDTRPRDRSVVFQFSGD